MKFKLLLINLAFIPLILNALPPINEIRTQFLAGVEDEKIIRNLLKELDTSKIKLQPIYIGYFGASQALLAKHSWNPYLKLEYLYISMTTLQSAISLEPQNLELRFLRFSIQHYIPSFLGVSKNLIEDRDMMIDLIKKKKFIPEDFQLVKNVIGFMLESHRCTGSQQIFLKSNL
ncbi:MAG: hypothetical protein H7329_05495 [Opitutaceae bacterium]|nr:hypothetical protein [Cytophagales bacterium]